LGSFGSGLLKPTALWYSRNYSAAISFEFLRLFGWFVQFSENFSPVLEIYWAIFGFFFARSSAYGTTLLTDSLGLSKNSYKIGCMSFFSVGGRTLAGSTKSIGASYSAMPLSNSSIVLSTGVASLRRSLSSLSVSLTWRQSCGGTTGIVTVVGPGFFAVAI
jgi:hypothetical protein